MSHRNVLYKTIDQIQYCLTDLKSLPQTKRVITVINHLNASCFLLNQLYEIMKKGDNNEIG